MASAVRRWVVLGFQVDQTLSQSQTPPLSVPALRQNLQASGAGASFQWKMSQSGWALSWDTCTGHADDYDHCPENERSDYHDCPCNKHPFILIITFAIIIIITVTIMLSFIILSSSNPHVKKKKVPKATPPLNAVKPIGHHQPPNAFGCFQRHQSIQRSQYQGITWWNWKEVDDNGSLPGLLLVDHFLEMLATCYFTCALFL